MFGRHAHRLNRRCEPLGSFRLAVDEPCNSFVVLANGGLPTGLGPVPRAFRIWRSFARWSPWFSIGQLVKAGCAEGLTPAEMTAYDAPFPTRRHRVWQERVPGARGQPHAVIRGAGTSCRKSRAPRRTGPGRVHPRHAVGTITPPHTMETPA